MNLCKNILLLLLLLAGIAWCNTAYAQPCSTSVAPVFTKSCFTEYITSISASGSLGTTSSIAVTGGTCSGPTYFDYFATQGIDAPVGAEVQLTIGRFTTQYTAYLSVYIDWNNNGLFEVHEYAGWPFAARDIQLDPAVMGTTYNVTLPCGTAAGNYRMRVMLSEQQNDSTAPCSGTYGQAYDFYYNSYCPNHRLLGDTALCRADTATLYASYGCGLWSSSNTAVATVDTNGLVTGRATAGMAVIVYSSFACGISKDTVTVGPDAVTGSQELCVGRSVTLTSGTAGGTWASSNGYVATVTGTGGTSTVAGAGSGFVTISYFSNGCSASLPITVNATVGISGPDSVCDAGTITLTVANPGGTWTSSNTGVVTVNSSGVVSGVAAGTAVITYQTVGGGCLGFKTIEVVDVYLVVSSPSGFTGAMCKTKIADLDGYPSGGTWASSAPSIAGVLSSGQVNGQSVGSAVISYTYMGCVETYDIDVNDNPNITGPTSVCVGNSMVLHTSIAGGTWYIHTFYASLAPLSTNDVTVTGLAAQTGSIISYTEPSFGCKDVHYVDVGGTTITGASGICDGNSISLTGWPSGGTWSSSNTGVATVSSGVVTSVSTGTANITYALGACYSIKTITVSTQPTLSGASSVCRHSDITVTASSPGGAWSSSNSSVATVGPGSAAVGVVHGVNTGTVTITYDLDGCIVLHSVTVQQAAIPSGPIGVCSGGTATLTASVSGGTWSSSNSGIASVSGGVVTGITSGTANISYTIAGCSRHQEFTVYTSPTLTGPNHICGSVLTNTVYCPLSGTPSGGNWSSNSLIASVSSTGVVSTSGGAHGVVIIRYGFGICTTYHSLSIVAQPYRVTGLPSIIAGLFPWDEVISASPTGGYWTPVSGFSFINLLSMGTSGGASQMKVSTSMTATHHTHSSVKYYFTDGVQSCDVMWDYWF